MGMSEPNSNRPPPIPPQVDSSTALKVRKQPQVGDILDGTYRLDAPLGRGGVGVVYKAFHLHLQRPCAVKFMHPQLVANPELRTRFRREAQSAFQLGHPHIVAITDFRDDPSAWPYLAMELVVGETLRDRLDRGPLPPRLALRLMIELCDALNAAHRRGVIHRDLKPENLFLIKVESPGPGELETSLKVLDFGLSKLLDGVEITGSGRLLGSPSYMSPEQARGESHLVDVRSDIFSVGALLYECLHGDKMFNAERLEQKRQQIMAAKLPPLQFGARGVPSVDAIIARACALRPEDRYQTAAALQDALEEAERLFLAMPSAIPAEALVVPVSSVASMLVAHERSVNPSGPSQATGGELIEGGAERPQGRPFLVGIVAGIGLVVASLVGFVGYTHWMQAKTLVATDPMHAPVPTSPPQGEPVGNRVTGSPDEKPVVGVVSAAGGVIPGETPQPVVVLDLPTQAKIGTGPSAQVPPASAKVGDSKPPVPSGTPITAPAGSPGGPVAKWSKKPRGLALVAKPVAPVAAAPGKPGSGLNDSVQNVNGIMRRAAPAVLKCYGDAPPPHKISADLTIQQDGRVAEANLDGAEDGASCVLQVVRGLRFPAPTDGDSYGFRYDFVNLRR